MVKLKAIVPINDDNIFYTILNRMYTKKSVKSLSKCLRFPVSNSRIRSLIWFYTGRREMDFSNLYIKMLIFSVLLVIGYLAARKGYLSRDFAKSASWLLVNVLLTSSIVNSVLGARPDLPPKDLWFAFFLLTGLTALLYVIATFCARFDNRETAPQTILLLAAVNTLFVGLPVVQVLKGSEAVFYLGISCVPYNVLFYSYGIWCLTKEKSGNHVRLADMISPPLVAALFALVVFVFHIRLPKAVTEFFSTVSAGTVPVSMLVIGATLGPVRLTEAFLNKKLWLFSLIRLILTPVAIYFLLRLFVSNEVLLLSAHHGSFYGHTSASAQGTVLK